MAKAGINSGQDEVSGEEEGVSFWLTQAGDPKGGRVA
jgi:hypothetical protein